MVNVKVTKGNDVSITCNSDASPPVPSAEITWKKDGEVVSDITDGVLSLSQVTTHAHSIYFLRLMIRKNINRISLIPRRVLTTLPNRNRLVRTLDLNSIIGRLDSWTTVLGIHTWDRSHKAGGKLN